jgi:hypothetical protein
VSEAVVSLSSDPGRSILEAPALPTTARNTNQPPIDPDNPPPSGPLTHWVDTNVMLEIYSHGDLYDAFERWQRGDAPVAAVEARRIQMQSSLWMAMAMSEVGARSVSFQHENLKNILRLAPPHSPRASWTASVLYVLGDGGVFGRWERFLTNDGVTLSNRDRDRHMVNECRTDQLVLVTRDAQVLREAQALGVDALLPELFAVRHLTREAARRLFGERLAVAVDRYVATGSGEDPAVRNSAGAAIQEVYAAIWSPPDEPWFYDA